MFDAVRTERMDVTLAHAAPVHELDAELERGLGGADEIVFIEAQQTVEVQDVRDGGLADADDADRIGFDHLDPDVGGIQQARESGGGHPPGRAPADDHDVAYAKIGHGQAAPAGQYRRMKSSCVGMACAALIIARRIDSRLSCTAACGNEATIGSHRFGMMFCPRNTATQLGLENNSSS